ncbi:MAG TPA: TadE/TadG family type IV pilus assembly protein [Candidatus Binataceae bacterium]|jgi:Flp pilus assembly protein TadG|nr:TadE/TadG family type IV pilus assembly protein [Candidatus Binataceae bacterium]
MSIDTARALRWRLMGLSTLRQPNLGRQYDRASRGQAAVELALIAPVLTVLVLVGIQFAIIGTAALALGQVNYEGARYAANNGTDTQAQIQSYMVSVAAPIISAHSGSYLTSTLSPAPPCSFGGSVTVSVTLDTNHLIALPNPFFGISFPKSLTNSETAFCES